jgi:hypothetical protein
MFIDILQKQNIMSGSISKPKQKAKKDAAVEERWAQLYESARCRELFRTARFVTNLAELCVQKSPPEALASTGEQKLSPEALVSPGTVVEEPKLPPEALLSPGTVVEEPKLPPEALVSPVEQKLPPEALVSPGAAVEQKLPPEALVSLGGAGEQKLPPWALGSAYGRDKASAASNTSSATAVASMKQVGDFF